MLLSMKTAKSGHNTVIIRLEPGDEIIGAIETACAQENWENAVVHGIGSVENPLLAHYRLDHKKFTQKKLSGIYEITGLQGNIAPFKGKPLVHIHVSVSNAEMQAFGGHLVEGYCSATAELIIERLDSNFQKIDNPVIGLKTWELPT